MPGAAALPPTAPLPPRLPNVQAAIKTAVGQFTLFPVYLGSFFAYMGLLEGLPPRQVRPLHGVTAQGLTGSGELRDEGSCDWCDLVHPALPTLRPQCVQKVQQAFVPTYTMGWGFWPVANIVNFMWVPATQRVLFANMAGLAWNAILSLANSTKGQVAAAGGTAPSGGGSMKKLR